MESKAVSFVSWECCRNNARERVFTSDVPLFCYSCGSCILLRGLCMVVSSKTYIPLVVLTCWLLHHICPNTDPHSPGLASLCLQVDSLYSNSVYTCYKSQVTSNPKVFFVCLPDRKAPPFMLPCLCSQLWTISGSGNSGTFVNISLETRHAKQRYVDFTLKKLCFEEQKDL